MAQKSKKCIVTSSYNFSGDYHIFASDTIVFSKMGGIICHPESHEKDIIGRENLLT